MWKIIDQKANFILNIFGNIISSQIINPSARYLSMVNVKSCRPENLILFRIFEDIFSL
jgi:hypothetical protein